MKNSAFVLSPLDTVIIAPRSFCGAGRVVGGARTKQDSAGYFLASDRLPWWFIGSAFVSTSVSSEQIVGTVGAAYQHGMAIANWEWWCLPTYTLLLLLFIPVYLKNRIATVPEFLSKRFGPLCGDIYSWVMLAAYVLVFQVPVLYGSTLVFSKLTGWSFFAVLWGTVALVGLYSIKGGLASVMWTDAVQCVMLLGGGIILYFVAIANIPGGWAATVARQSRSASIFIVRRMIPSPFPGLITGSLRFSVLPGEQPGDDPACAGRPLDWDGMMGIVFAGFINLFRPLVTCFLGFIVYFWVNQLHRAPPLENQDLAFPFALTEFASGYGLRGIILAGFLAAVMSTVSALANSTATIFALDIYKRVIRKEADDRQTVRVGQSASLLALVIAALLCPAVAKLGAFYRYFQTGVTMLATPFISVFLLSMLWKRANFRGAVFGLIGGLVIQCAVAFGAPMIGIKLHWLYAAFIAQVIIMAGVVAVSLATAPPDEERVAPFVWRPALLASANVDAARPWYQSIRFWFGLYAVIWFCLYWRFW